MKHQFGYDLPPGVSVKDIEGVQGEGLPIPTNEESVAWAEEATVIADVLRELADKFDGIDNGRCTVCRVGHRLWLVPGKKKGTCDYEPCLSHRISKILDQYEKPSEGVIERMRQKLPQGRVCTCGEGDACRLCAGEPAAKVSAYGFPRRHCLYLFTPAEKAIYDALQAVEAVGAHPLLTDAVVLLGQARDKVADYVDTQIPEHAPYTGAHNES
jgi:hypothetical protein